MADWLPVLLRVPVLLLVPCRRMHLCKGGARLLQQRCLGGMAAAGAVMAALVTVVAIVMVALSLICEAS